MTWLIQSDARPAAIEQHDFIASLATRTPTQLAADLGSSVEEIQAAAEGESAAAAELEIRDGVAVINMAGVLLDKPNWIYELFGVPHADYQTIAAQVNQANGDPSVKEIRFAVDSPGGLARGITDCADAIFASGKPTTAIVRNTCASAAYWLASQCNQIHATGRMDQIGSVGVAVEHRVSDYRVGIASTDAPNKRPNVRTEQGRAIVRRELDDLHALFVADIARGRRVSAEHVAANFGRGGVLLAADAILAGMIDESGQVAVPAANLATMNLDQLKSEHPEAYAAAVAVGAKSERERVCAHLDLGSEAGAMDVAIEAVKAGDDLGNAQIAKYHVAKLSQVKIGQRADETVAPVSSPTAKPAAEEDATQAIFAEAANLLGQESPFAP